MNLGVLASHEGTTLQSLLDAFAIGLPTPPVRTMNAPIWRKSSIFWGG